MQLETYMNQQAKANEVTALSVIVHRAVNQDGPTSAPEKGFQSFSMVFAVAFVRPPAHRIAAPSMAVRVGATARWRGIPH